ncbi:MAG: hypothetical protein PWP16_1328 [Eubacteriaceae bacterium]|jgi:hypothetical protein|nr:hypothetical protein [Eubacteriaceae bacterium]
MIKHKYSDKQKEFIRKFAFGHSRKEITEEVNKKFGIELKVSQITAFLKNNKIKTGRTGYFEKGHEPANKGKKGSDYGWEPTQFKKGNRPENALVVGTEINRPDGYKWVKIAEPNIWKQKHRIIWEEVNGDIPDNHVLIFLDGDKQNICLENLMLITKQERLIMNRKNLIYSEKELTETGALVAKVLAKQYERSNKKNGTKKNDIGRGKRGIERTAAG